MVENAGTGRIDFEVTLEQPARLAGFLGTATVHAVPGVVTLSGISTQKPGIDSASLTQDQIKAGLSQMDQGTKGKGSASDFTTMVGLKPKDPIPYKGL